MIGPEHQVGLLRERLCALGCGETGANQVEFIRITDGIPSVPRDLGHGDLPNEGNLEEDAISYTKGCYLGQEVMARLKNLGRVRRRLFVVRGTGNPPGARTPLFQRDRKVGEIRSVASQGDGFVAMAMLALLDLDEATGLGLAPGAPPTISITIHG
jgi:folate-binding protein YgfZ